ncbi:hypothetical protein BGZ60DRAFT_403265 [Tricladium varicosporioides]|nr:hypothetical protein BGZ60DRAFT_403265 [Hymenoscyphus varicosporioides]
MAPPRLQCFNSFRALAKQSSSSRAAFSTSLVVRAEDDSQYPPPLPKASGMDFLNDIMPAAPSRTPPPPRTQSSLFENSGPLPGPTHDRVQRSYQPSYQRSALGASSLMDRAANRIQAMPRSLRPTNKYTSTPLPSANRAETLEEIKSSALGQELGRLITRRWKVGDVYAPHDLSAVEMDKWQKKGRPLHDALDALNLKPLDHYRNFSMMSEYMTPMGRIKHSKDTGLRPVNQRRMAKAIRRTIGMGIMPSVHRHPELLQITLQRQARAAVAEKNADVEKKKNRRHRAS